MKELLGIKEMMTMKNKEVNANKIFACQQVLSEVIGELVKDEEMMKIAYSLSKLNNGELDDIRKEVIKKE